MKKTGFTLTELLISLAIIGVVAAVTVPNLKNMIPDENKGTVLKVYKTITEINNDIFNDPGLYYCPDINTGGAPLLCTLVPSDGQHGTDVDSLFQGEQKYPRLFAEKIQLASSIGSSNAANTVFFTTTDGIKWTFEYKRNNASGDTWYIVTIDVGEKHGNSNCTYSSSTCTNPRLFSFKVDKFGVVTGEDALTKAYILNPKKLNDRDTDIAKAKSLE